MRCLESDFRPGSERMVRSRDEESGQTLVEYALIIALVAVAAIAAVGFLSGRIQGLFSEEGSSVGNAT